jgi:hypothetical protein
MESMAATGAYDEEILVRLTREQVRILVSITGPRVANPDAERLGDWSVDLDRRLRKAISRTAADTSYWRYGNSRSEALRQAVALSLEEDVPDDDLSEDPLASLLDALPEWHPFDRIVLRRDQLHIYVYIGKHFGGHGLAEALYNMIRLASPRERVTPDGY